MLLLVSATTREPLTYQGCVIVHDGPFAEAEFLVRGAAWADVPGREAGEVGSRLGIPAMLLKDHPAMASTHWPVERKAFRG
jgi:hypothetical protein